MDKIDPGMASFPHPSTFHFTIMAEPSMAAEHRYFGRVKTVNTTPPSVVIIPEDRTIRADYDRAAISHTQLVKFLNYLGSRAGMMRVSYVLRPGPTGVLVAQDVQKVEAVEVKKEGSHWGAVSGPGESSGRNVKKEVKKEGSPSRSASGLGGLRIKEENDTSSQAGFVASQHVRISFEEEARRNERGEFRDRNGGLPSHSGALKWDEWNGEGGRARSG